MRGSRHLLPKLSNTVIHAAGSLREGLGPLINAGLSEEAFQREGGLV